jgi:hypothetical protein
MNQPNEVWLHLNRQEANRVINALKEQNEKMEKLQVSGTLRPGEHRVIGEYIGDNNIIIRDIELMLDGSEPLGQDGRVPPKRAEPTAVREPEEPKSYEPHTMNF